MQVNITEQQHSVLLKENEQKAAVLRKVILYIMSNQLAVNAQLEGACTAEEIVKRLYHDRLVGINKAIYDESLTLWDRVKAYATRNIDATYGRAMASRFGFHLEDASLYDVNRYPGDLRIMLRGEELYNFCMYLISIGAKPHNRELCNRTDGINHINIYSKGRTELGKFLSMFYTCENKHKTPHGKFKTLEGYYHFLRLLEFYEWLDGKPIKDWSTDGRLVNSETYRLRDVDGSAAIRLGRDLKESVYGGTSYRPMAFKDVTLGYLVTALIYKLCDGTMPDAWKQLKMVVDSKIPLLHYYVVDGKVHTPTHSELIPELFKSIASFIDPETEVLSAFDLTKHTDAIVAHYRKSQEK